MFTPFALVDLVSSPMVLFTTEKMVSSLDLWWCTLSENLLFISFL